MSFLSIFSIPLTTNSPVNSIKIHNYPKLSSSYSDYSPLVIDSDVALQSLAHNENWPGNGSSSNPFLFEGKFINASSVGTAGIFLKDISFHLVIQNNYLLASDSGSIGLQGSFEGSYGILVSSSTNIIIRNNIIVNQSWWGIAITDNYGVKSSSNIFVENNTFFSSESTTGAIIVSRSHNISLSYNNISNCFYGMNIFAGENLTISYNEILFTNYAIQLEYVENSLIQFNILAGSQRFGLEFGGIVGKSYYTNGTLIDGFSPNTVSNNDFISNNLVGYYSDNLSQALDSGVDNNLWDHNYWDNYPNSMTTSGYQINRSIGINKYSYDMNPQKIPIRASEDLITLIDEHGNVLESKTSNFSFPASFLLLTGLVLLRLKKNKYK
jgi:parallel beta-helix repeat protein